MDRTLSTSTASNDHGNANRTVLLVAILLATIYSCALFVLERRYAINPDYTGLEVVIGFLIALLPTAFVARNEARFRALSWQDYESLVWYNVVGSGIPVAIWQALEFVLRRI